MMVGGLDGDGGVCIEDGMRVCGSDLGSRDFWIWEEGITHKDHPIHFVGHSADAQVIRVLQQMLADKAFRGYENSSENWVLSVTTLSGARLNGGYDKGFPAGCSIWRVEIEPSF